MLDSSPCWTHKHIIHLLHKQLPLVMQRSISVAGTLTNIRIGRWVGTSNDDTPSPTEDLIFRLCRAGDGKSKPNRNKCIPIGVLLIMYVHTMKFLSPPGFKNTCTALRQDGSSATSNRQTNPQLGWVMATVGHLRYP